MGKLIDSIRERTGRGCDEYLYDAVVRGQNAAQIAAEFGVSREAVRKHLRRLNASARVSWQMRKPRRRAA